MSKRVESSRRAFLRSSAGAAGGVLLGGCLPGVLAARQAPAVVALDASRPLADWGLQIGDVLADRAIVWSRADRESRLVVEWSLDAQFNQKQRIVGPYALETSDYTARVDLSGLPQGREIFGRLSVIENLRIAGVRLADMRGYAYDRPIAELPTINAGDRVKLRCSYDNTMGNAFVKKALAEQHLTGPQTVHLGEQTLDEMCLGAFTFFRPNLGG